VARQWLFRCKRPYISEFNAGIFSGVYQCGPASVEAVKCGAIGFNYDVSFMLSTVNADLVRWKEDNTSEFNYSKIDSNKYQ
jgi:transglutaminase 1